MSSLFVTYNAQNTNQTPIRGKNPVTVSADHSAPAFGRVVESKGISEVGNKRKSSEHLKLFEASRVEVKTMRYVVAYLLMATGFCFACSLPTSKLS
jgi:hypothetical protein